MNVVALIQARMGSTRFPGKVMKPLAGRPMIQTMLERLSRAQRISKIVVATSIKPENDPLADIVTSLGFGVFHGDENDVLDRFYHAAVEHHADAVIRLTADCPLIDPEVVDAVVEAFQQGGVDYASNVEPPTFPDGLDTEVFSFAVLERAWKEATQPLEREHVTPYLRKNDFFPKINIAAETDWSAERWTVDEPADLVVMENILAHFSPRTDMGWREIMDLKSRHPECFTPNSHIPRNEGAKMATGPKLWKRAKRVIPGGNMLLSKRAEMFLPDHWPAYYSKADGVHVWDMDGRQLVDMCFAVGACTLGYNHPEISEAVIQSVRDGVMTTLNCPEEVRLAEKLIEMNPWAGMVRFARSGGEANAIAIRIARAHSGKDKVAICGYHGWHDWYLSANLGDDENLAGHLLPGLEAKGVPQHLRGTVFPFEYNRLDQLQALVEKHDIGVIKMEVCRNFGPENRFLENIRDLATEKGIVLVFDECTSGFRETFGGLHQKYGVEPDLAMFGKALGNGHAITAVVGREEVMQAAQTTFISSTFWTERIGPVAALKTLEVMERTRSWEKISETGRQIKAGWSKSAKTHGLAVDIGGLDALASLTFRSPRALAYKTLLTQEMLKRGYLASNLVYTSLAHTGVVVEGYIKALDEVFALIRTCAEGQSEEALLDGPVCHSGFKRLN
ncbi:MAG: aminotransferase class III-fold pyridoxal phosphate-dependent enzyme [Candidatus Methylacidiphilales bacterium]